MVSKPRASETELFAKDGITFVKKGKLFPVRKMGQNVFLDGIFFGSSRESFSKKISIVQNGQQTFRSDFVTEGLLLYLYFIFGIKIIAGFFQIYSFLIEAIVKLRKIPVRKKLFDLRLGNCQLFNPLGYGTQILQIYKDAIERTSRQKVQKVLYKLVSATMFNKNMRQFGVAHEI